MSTRIWKPSISYGGDAQELPKPYQQQQDFGPKLTNNDSNNVRVSLQHQPLVRLILASIINFDIQAGAEGIWVQPNTSPIRKHSDS